MHSSSLVLALAAVAAAGGAAATFVGDEEGEAREEQAQRHQRESDEQQVTATKGVNGVDGRDGEEPVDQTVTHRGEKSLRSTETSILKHGGGVVGNDVDAAELCQLAKLFRIHLSRVYPLVA